MRKASGMALKQSRRKSRPVRAKSTFAYEIDEARSVQQAMVPAEPLRADQLAFEYKFRPVKDVGGDFLDYFWMPDRRLGFFVGDVVGKGLPAALYAALTVGILRGINKGSGSPKSVLEFLNRRLLDRAVPHRYCAVQYAVFNPLSLEISVSNAGLRPPPLLISATSCREIGNGGVPCGLFREARYRQETTKLAPGDTVLFSTDGLLEAQNPRGLEFGLERLKKVCAQNKDSSASALLDRVFDAVDNFSAGVPQHDDMTAAVLHLG